MDKNQFLKFRLYATSAVTVAIWSLLIWEHFHGGVPSHHILADENLPKISNWWGALLIPALSWFLLYRTQKRLFNAEITINTSEEQKKALLGFLGALLIGFLVVVCFSLGYPSTIDKILLGILLMAFFMPVYRSECILGFVLGMTYTFGAVLPIAVACILAAIGFVIYRFIRKGILFLVSQLKK